MNSFSNVTIVGRLTRNAELKNTQSGGSVLSFGVAIDRKRKSADGTMTDDPTFIDVSYFAPSALNICQFMEKGTQVGITGELNQRKWVANDGSNVSKIEIIANNVHLIESKEATELRRGRSNANFSDASSNSFQGQQPNNFVASNGNFTRTNMSFSSNARTATHQAPKPEPNQVDFGPDSFDDDQDVPF